MKCRELAIHTPHSLLLTVFLLAPVYQISHYSSDVADAARVREMITLRVQLLVLHHMHFVYPRDPEVNS